MQVESELGAAGLGKEAIAAIMAAMQVRSLQDLQSLLGSESAVVQQLQRLFELAAGYGYDDWLVFDASIVRGLAYYTGKMRLRGYISPSTLNIDIAARRPTGLWQGRALSTTCPCLPCACFQCQRMIGA